MRLTWNACGVWGWIFLVFVAVAFAEPVRDLGATEVKSDAADFVSLKNYTEISAEVWEGKSLSAADVLSALPGIETHKQGGLGSFQTISIRGIAGRNILIALDGVPVNDGAGGAFDLGQIDLNQIEKIEIYKDKIPVKFGGKGIGGAVNFVSKSVTLNAHKKMEGRFLNAVGSHGFFTSALQAQAKISDSVKFVGSISVRHSDNDYEFKSKNGTEYNTHDDYMDTRKNAEYTEYSGNLNLQILHPKNYFSNIRLKGNFAEGGNPGHGDNQTQIAGFKGENFTLIYGLDFPQLFNFLWLESKVAFAYEKNVSHSFYPLDKIGFSSNEFLEYGASGLKFFPEIMGSFYGEKIESSLRVAPSYTEFKAEGNSNDWKLSRGEISVAGEVLYAFFDGLSLGGESSIWAVRDDILGGKFYLPTLSKDLNDEIKNHFSYSALGTLKWGNSHSKIQGKTSFGRFFRNPELMELYGVYPGVVSNPDLKDESALRFETSVQFSTAKKRSILGISLYKTWSENGIFWLISGDFLKPMNLGKSEIAGVEFDLESKPVDFLKVILRATLQEPLDMSAENYYYKNQLTFEPKQSYLAEATFYLPLRLSFTWSSLYRTKIYEDRANRRVRPAVPYHKAVLEFRPFSSTEFLLAVNNISDETYRNVYDPFPTPGREFQLTWIQKF